MDETWLSRLQHVCVQSISVEKNKQAERVGLNHASVFPPHQLQQRQKKRKHFIADTGIRTIGPEPYIRDKPFRQPRSYPELSTSFLKNIMLMFVSWQTPTCVSSQDDRPYPFMEPWAYDGPFERSMSRLRNYLEFNGAKVSFVPQAS